jgi:hypothetical protein
VGGIAVNLQLNKNNSLRFRISKTELELLQSGQKLAEELLLPNSKIGFSVEVFEQEKISVSNQNNLIELFVPQKILKFLSDNFPSKSGVEQEIEVSGGEKLLVKLEVDVFQKRR